jgi:hypothetical protein
MWFELAGMRMVQFKISAMVVKTMALAAALAVVEAVMLSTYHMATLGSRISLI